MNTTHRRTTLVLALLASITPFFIARAQTGSDQITPTAPKIEIKTSAKMQFKGKVIPLKDLLKQIGSKIDPDAAPHWLALVTEKSEIYPLIKDDGAKMFFTDAKTRNRPMRLTGRLIAGTHLLQVLDIRSYKNGQLCDIYYWCDVCSIRRSAGGICDCCNGPLFLREELLRK